MSKNPAITSQRRSKISKKTWRERKAMGGKGSCHFCGEPIFAGGVSYQRRPYHKTCLEFEKFGLSPAQITANPRRKRDGIQFYGATALNPRGTPRTEEERRQAHLARFGTTTLPPRGTGQRRIYQDMSLTNPRPPATWWAKIWAKMAAQYPRGPRESIKTWKKAIDQITAGIWWGYPGDTRERLIAEYDVRAVPAAALANPNVQHLACPMCRAPNPVSATDLYVRCCSCGAPLRRVKVRQNKGRR